MPPSCDLPRDAFFLEMSSGVESTLALPWSAFTSAEFSAERKPSVAGPVESSTSLTGCEVGPPTLPGSVCASDACFSTPTC